MRNDEDVRLKHISVEDINLVIKKMVPYDSPLAERVQALVFDLISLSSKYLLDMQEFASSADPILLSDEDCQAIIAMVKTNKNTETWAVSYMLAQFTTDHKDKLCYGSRRVMTITIKKSASLVSGLGWRWIPTHLKQTS